MVGVSYCDARRTPCRPTVNSSLGASRSAASRSAAPIPALLSLTGARSLVPRRPPTPARASGRHSPANRDPHACRRAGRLDLDSRRVIDSHTHLVLCDEPEAEVVAAARDAGVGRMLTVGMDAETNPAAIAAAERHDEVFAAVGRHPNEASRVRRRRGGGNRPPRRPREGAGDRRDRPRLLPRQRSAGGAAARLRRPDRDRPRARPADRDPRPRPRGRHRGGRRDLRHPRRPGGGSAGDPALLLGAAAGRPPPPSAAGTAPSPATSPTRSPRRCGSRRRRCRRSGSWSRPMLPT